MKYNIFKLCGMNNLSVKFDKEFTDEFINSLLEKFSDFDIKDRKEDSIWLKQKEKDIVIYKYGEILFLGFSEEEVRKYLTDIASRHENTASTFI